MLDFPVSSAFAPAAQIAWHGVPNAPSPPTAATWRQITVQAQQLSISTTTAVEDRVHSAMHDHGRRGARPSFPNFSDIDSRIQALRIEAEIDQIPFSNASHAEFRDFLRQIAARVRPAIFLRDNGNLRAVWKNDDQEQIGLQFLGGRDVQFVILKRRLDGKLTTLSGVASTSELLTLVKAVQATALLG
jgi:hypothetical protein